MSEIQTTAPTVVATTLGQGNDAKKPRLLVVDDAAQLLPRLAEEYEYQGFDVVKCHIKFPTTPAATDGQSDINFSTIGEITQYALNHANRIDAVLTDLSGATNPRDYGYALANDLHDKCFNGPVAINTVSHGERTNYKNTLGVFDKSSHDEIANAIKSALRGQCKTV